MRRYRGKHRNTLTTSTWRWAALCLLYGVKEDNG